MVRTEQIQISALPGRYELRFRLVIDFAGLCPRSPFLDLTIQGHNVNANWGCYHSNSTERHDYVSLTAPTASAVIEQYEQWCRDTFAEILDKARFVQEQTVRVFSLDAKGRLRADEQVIKVSPPLPSEDGK